MVNVVRKRKIEETWPDSQTGVWHLVCLSMFFGSERSPEVIRDPVVKQYRTAQAPKSFSS
ncbi:hypothetical protein HETIRDRAFT_174776 [Heterobasidion irregulare TC 32-1]|uniref:Uncharacterized protein n=1 Tax=Heterobasidion irregulare (strain TC 32-1) TaxID=747525 RepID=W4JTC5_HETIT|nr:uncharacterized protein HETIRDRAFT_174776 [Heterobasidion irregulare TC 32-1]ETW76719.1 hypothetical protein HETIRDRAFT_174776 [Heterobasidion irregulare TC 32-1]